MQQMLRHRTQADNQPSQSTRVQRLAGMTSAEIAGAAAGLDRHKWLAFSLDILGELSGREELISNAYYWAIHRASVERWQWKKSKHENDPILGLARLAVIELQVPYFRNHQNNRAQILNMKASTFDKTWRSRADRVGSEVYQWSMDGLMHVTGFFGVEALG